MGFVSPMLASPMPPNFTIQPSEFAAEEKMDGHRLLVEVSQGKSSLFVEKGIHAWSRYGLPRTLPTHIMESLECLPNGLYDGELIVPGKRAYGVTELVNSPDLVYIVFDAIRIEEDDYTILPYDVRRKCLQIYMSQFDMEGAVRLAESWNVDSMIEVCKLRDQIWERDGEGLILKRRNAPYMIGKRSKNLIKVKSLRSAVLTVVTWVESRGEKNYRGKYASVVLRDIDGFTTTVKTRNDALLAHLEAEATKLGHPPYIGRKLRIEFQERTPDGSYRHPRWDRWEDE
jgi:ATP-dependent DNA ligase